MASPHNLPTAAPSAPPVFPLQAGCTSHVRGPINTGRIEARPDPFDAPRDALPPVSLTEGAGRAANPLTDAELAEYRRRIDMAVDPLVQSVRYGDYGERLAFPSPEAARRELRWMLGTIGMLVLLAGFCAMGVWL